MDTLNNLELFEALFEAAPEGILVLDDQGAVKRANATAEWVFGYTAEKIRQKNIDDLVPGLWAKIHKNQKGSNKDSALEKIENSTSTWGNKVDGSQFPLEVKWAFKTIDDKRFVLVFVRDITAEELMGRELRSKETKNKALLEAIPDMMFILNLKGDFIDVHIPEHNETFISGAGIIGTNIKKLFHPNLYRDLYDCFENTAKTKENQKAEFRVDKNGLKDYEIRFVPMNNHNIMGIVREITAAKQAENKLRQEKNKLQHYLDTAASMFVVINKDGTIELVNKKTCEVLGYEQEELIGKEWFKTCLPKDEQKPVRNVFERIIHGEIPLEEYYENHVITKQGKKPLIRWRNAILTDDSGQVAATLSSGIDITTQKQTEEELRASAAKNHALLEAIPDHILVVNAKGKYLDFYEPNDPGHVYLPKEQVVGRNMKDLLPQDLYVKLKRTIDQTLKTKENHKVEYALARNGELRQYETSIVYLQKDQVLAMARDITEKKKAAKDLNIRNRALDAAGNGILIVDAQKPDQPIIYCNDAFQKITGYSKDEVLGKNCRFLQNDDRDQEAVAIMQSAIAKGKGCQVELRNYKKDGTLFWNQLTITPVHDEAGKPTHFIGVQNDVTDRKQDEQLKDEVRQILELATKNKPLREIAIEIINGIETYVEECCASILLLKKESGTLHILMAPNVPKAFSEGIEGLEIGPKKGSCGTAAFLKKEIIVEDVANDPLWEAYKNLAQQSGIKACWSLPIYSSIGDVLGTFAVYGKRKGKPKKKELEIVKDMARLTGLAIEHHVVKQDLEISQKKLEEYANTLELKVSERTKELRETVKKLVEANLRSREQTALAKASEQKARTNYEIFSAIAKNFPKGIIIVFNANMEIVYIEGEELQRIDLKKADFEGKQIDDIDIFSERRMGRIKSDIEKTLSGKHLSFEIEFGTEIYAVNSAPMYAQKDAVWALFVYSNITEQKQVEIEIRNTLQKEKELSELKSRFVSMASHEFRTPLSAILSSAILIEKQNTPDKAEKRLKYIDQIKTNVRNLVVILNDFLSLGKLEEGKIISQPESFDLLLMTRSLVEEITADKKEVQQIVLHHQGNSTSVFLDPKLMRHILINLLSNAMKYSKENTTITLTIIWEDNTVSVRIKDEGMGIPKAEQEHLFERFFRARNAENIQGTGLGLHIVKQYTELMGGTVSFTSEEGKGTTFTLDFPIG
ncbi:PAS domain S-box protein [Flagellimonas lutaonensis]|uniref:histidine kinase n=1 Tax=Flagellimonas lutaonensis TaxID=516051 RepID=A0A0D5YQV1_9FLAO|nr:PAS domain S-box protein [Allomuricauda lutaonensis]AKA34221.1 Two-component system-Sensor histidine kinase [Allomuricauda lutaonensis]